MDGNPKQQVAEKLRDSSSVLVTVSTNPSIDQLASAIGLSLMLTKLGKHTTTVFSGNIPNVLEFLNPEKTIDSTVDGLRDFIISLDKDKADKLRYKVEDNVVKIFITPYKDKITSKDLNFSQGDYNVDLVVALGVHSRGDLDAAITAHGRILHDATIVTINTGKGKDTNLSAIDWTDESASCLSEMLVSISEALEGGILDQQMSTAFLTGIVAATERFKNERTSPKVMTMAAQLMAAGANQQLIATNLQVKKASKPKKDERPKKSNKSKPKKSGTVDLSGGNKNQKDSKLISAPKDDDSTINVDENGVLTQIEEDVNAKHLELDENGRTKHLDANDPAVKSLKNELAQDNTSSLLEIEGRVNSLKVDEPPKDTDELEDDDEAEDVDNSDAVLMYDTDNSDEDNDEDARVEDVIAAPSINRVSKSKLITDDIQSKPQMGGALNSISEDQIDRHSRDRSNAINQEVLTHKVIQPSESFDPDSSGDAEVAGAPSVAEPSLMDDLAEARKAVEEAMDESQFAGGSQPIQALNAAPMPLDATSMEDFNLTSQPATSSSPQLPQIVGGVPPEQQTRLDVSQLQTQSAPQPQPQAQPQPQQMVSQQPVRQQPAPTPQQPLAASYQQAVPQQQPATQLPQNPLYANNQQQQNFQQPMQQQPNQYPQQQVPQQQVIQQQQPQIPLPPPPMPPLQPPPMPPFN